jgi:hypothetical protein
MSRLWQDERDPEEEGPVVYERPMERDRSNDVEYRRWGWRRSAKGNLYRKLKDGPTVTVVPDRRHPGLWVCCIARGGGNVSYSARKFSSEADAVFAFMDEPILGMGGG